MIAEIWAHGDLEEITEKISADKARMVFAHIDRTHNAEIGVNWDVLHEAIDHLG